MYYIKTAADDVRNAMTKLESVVIPTTPKMSEPSVISQAPALRDTYWTPNLDSTVVQWIELVRNAMWLGLRNLAESEGFEPSIQVLARIPVWQSIGPLSCDMYSSTWYSLSASQSCGIYLITTSTDTQCVTQNQCPSLATSFALWFQSSHPITQGTRLSGENSSASSGIYWKRIKTTGCRPGG
jgi:hypothetical protein